ncbi:hypothetical protein BDW60DRAFT_18880 [Aspergillus nidulans var. acristatus]
MHSLGWAKSGHERVPDRAGLCLATTLENRNGRLHLMNVFIIVKVRPPPIFQIVLGAGMKVHQDLTTNEGSDLIASCVIRRNTVKATMPIVRTTVLTRVILIIQPRCSKGLRGPGSFSKKLMPCCIGCPYCRQYSVSNRNRDSQYSCLMSPARISRYDGQFAKCLAGSRYASSCSQIKSQAWTSIAYTEGLFSLRS